MTQFVGSSLCQDILSWGEEYASDPKMTSTCHNHSLANDTKLGQQLITKEW